MPVQAMDRTVRAPSARPRRKRAPAPFLGVRAALAWAAALAGLLVVVVALPLLAASKDRAAPGAARARVREGLPAATARLPLSANAQISGALASGRPAYRAVPDGAGFAASNPAQGLTARFDEAGVRVTAASLSVQLRLRDLGAGGAHEAIGTVAPTASANRVDYSYAQLSQWYRNGPAGLEQGFVVRHAPGAGAAPLTLTLGLEGSVHAALSADAQTVTLSEGSQTLLYSGLVATDASGRTLRSRLALDRGSLILRVDAGHARYPLTIDPTVRVQQGAKLTSGEGEGGEARFGSSVALSADGSTLAVGGPHGMGSQGAVWIFARSGASWSKQAELTSGETTTSTVEECAEEAAEEAGECFFGSSVALSSDGNTALIGDPSGGSTPGAAWVFTRTGTSWERRQALTGSGAGGEGRFGRSVAISSDGSTALVGNPGAAGERGAAWVFVSSAGGFASQATLADAEASKFAHFGRSVALSSDGSTALIGGPAASSYLGAAWTFRRSGSSWAQQGGAVTGGNAEEPQGHFGRAVALSGDGNTALIGVPNDNGGRGAVWSFTRGGLGFAQPGTKLEAPSVLGEGHFGFGSSLALSGDGSTALVGAPRAEAGAGTVVELARSGSGWTIEQELLEGSDAVGKGASGASVALSGDGGLAAFGAPHDGRRSGAAWVFALEAASQAPTPTVANVLPGRGPTAGGTEVEIKGANFNAASSVSFGTTTASPTVVSNAKIKVIAPAEPAGKVDVTVTTPAGTSPISRPGDYYLYEGASTADPPAASTTTTTTGAALTSSGGVLGTTQSTAYACRVSLRSKRIVVARRNKAMVRLLRTGTGQCRGTLTLRYRQKGRGRHFKLRAIGSVRFAIAPGKSQVVSIKLNKLGRSLVVAGHGRLNASAAVVRTTPTPTLAKTASVRLSVKKKPKAKRAQA